MKFRKTMLFLPMYSIYLFCCVCTFLTLLFFDRWIVLALFSYCIHDYFFFFYRLHFAQLPFDECSVILLWGYLIPSSTHMNEGLKITEKCQRSLSLSSNRAEWNPFSSTSYQSTLFLLFFSCLPFLHNFSLLLRQCQLNHLHGLQNLNGITDSSGNMAF